MLIYLLQTKWTFTNFPTFLHSIELVESELWCNFCKICILLELLELQMNDNNYELAIALIQRKDVFQVSLPKKRRVGRSATPPTPFPTYLSFFFNATNSRQIHFCVHKSLKKFEQSLLKCSDKDKELRNFTLFSLLGLFYFEYFFFQNALKNSCQGVQARAGWESQHTYIFPKRRY